MSGNRYDEERERARRQERRRREKSRQAQRKRRRRKAFLFAALIAVLLVLIFLIRRSAVPSDSAGPASESAYLTASSQKSSPSESTDMSAVSEKSSASGSADASASPEDGGTSGSAKTVTLTSSEIHTGDLILVNSDHAYDFDANADTIDLVRIKSAQSFDYPVDKEDFEAASRIMPYLDAMIRDCDAACGTSSGEVSISSAYRSRDYQEQVLQEITEEYGEDYAAAYVAAPGYSEHHTGLAVDLGITLSDGTAGSFTGSDQAAWMSEHCAEYGFVRRYPEEKADVTGISNESWHFRYVGLPHAKYMTDHGLVLEEYLEYLRSSTSASVPLSVTADDGTSWSIWYTEDSSFEVPGSSYTVSGDNIAGYIISETAS